MEVTSVRNITVVMTEDEAFDLGLASYNHELSIRAKGTGSKFYEALPPELQAQIREHANG